MCDKLKGGHPIILSNSAREAYIKKLAKEYKNWHKIGGLSPYTIPIAQRRQNKRESKIDPAIVAFLKNNDSYDDAIFNWPNWKRYLSLARRSLGLYKTRRTIKPKKNPIQRKSSSKPNIVEEKAFHVDRPNFALSSENDGKWFDKLQDQGVGLARIRDLAAVRRQMRKELGIL